MKKLTCILMSALLLLSVIAYAETSVPEMQMTEVQTVEQKLYTMIPVLDSLARSLGIEGETAYDINDPQFVWTQLYLTAVNWNLDGEQLVMNDYQLRIPSATMKEYAQASFYDLVDLPEIPADMASVSYDVATDTYLMNMSDKGETFVVIERYATDVNGDLLVGMGLYGPDEAGIDERLGGLLIRLADNADQNAFALTSYPYSVKFAQMESAEDFANLMVASCDVQYIEAEFVTGTETETETETETPSIDKTDTYAKLSQGSKGDAVKALQSRLNKLGYNCGSSDGVFGQNTKDAVRYFQAAIGAKQDGVATNAVQKRLFASNAPEYVTYVQIEKGDTGIRVEKLQNYLRKLGYLAAPTDGDFGSRTKDAVKLFQKEADLKQDGIAGVNTLKALFKKNAPECDEYIDLQKGDTGSRVKELQNKLYKLGFSSKKASGTYDDNTVKAIKAFLAETGEDGNGKSIDSKTVKAIFNYTKPGATTAPPTEAPTTEPTATPTPGTDPTATPGTDPTATPGTDPTATPEPDPTATPEPDPTATPEPDPTATPEPDPTATPVPDPTATPVPDPTATPEPALPDSAITGEQLSAVASAINAELGTSKSEKEAVEWLQGKLGVTANGVYDASTKSAVSSFQTDKGLTATNGVADAETVTALNA